MFLFFLRNAFFHINNNFKTKVKKKNIKIKRKKGNIFLKNIENILIVLRKKKVKICQKINSSEIFVFYFLIIILYKHYKNEYKKKQIKSHIDLRIK